MQTSIDPKYIRIIEKIFVTIFFVYAVLGTNNITYGKSFITPVMWLSFALGGILLLYRLVHIKRYIKMTAIIPLFALLISIVISTLANYRYSFKDNVVICIYWALFFFILYAIDDERSISDVKKDVIYVCALYTIYISLSVLTSLIMMKKGVSEKIVVPDTGYEYYKGFAIGRLWGTFINPNTGAISAAITIILLIYFFGRYKNVGLRIVLIGDMLLQLLYIALSDSRSGAVCMGVVLAFYTFFSVIFRETAEKKDVSNEGSNGTANEDSGNSIIKQGNVIKTKKISYILIAVLLSLTLGFTGFYVSRKTKDVYNNVVAAIVRHNEEKIREQAMQELLEQGLSEEEIEAAIEEKLEDERESVLTIDRGYDLSNDVSNRRLDAWKSAVEVFLSSPKMIMLGASFKGFTQYALENMPETYIVNNTYGHFSTLDNEIFNVMDAQGLIGLIALFAVLVALFVGLFKYVFKVRYEDRTFVALIIAIVFGLAVSAMFCSVMFYHFSHNAVLFWVALGGLMYVVKKSATIELCEDKE